MSLERSLDFLEFGLRPRGLRKLKDFFGLASFEVFPEDAFESAVLVPLIMPGGGVCEGVRRSSPSMDTMDGFDGSTVASLDTLLRKGDPVLSGSCDMALAGLRKEFPNPTAVFADLEASGRP